MDVFSSTEWPKWRAIRWRKGILFLLGGVEGEVFLSWSLADVELLRAVPSSPSLKREMDELDVPAELSLPFLVFRKNGRLLKRLVERSL